MVANLNALTWEEVAALDLSKAVFVLPISSLEQHGWHLPLGTDDHILQIALDGLLRDPRLEGNMLFLPQSGLAAAASTSTSPVRSPFPAAPWLPPWRIFSNACSATVRGQWLSSIPMAGTPICWMPTLRNGRRGTAYGSLQFTCGLPVFLRRRPDDIRTPVFPLISMAERLKRRFCCTPCRRRSEQDGSTKKTTGLFACPHIVPAGQPRSCRRAMACWAFLAAPPHKRESCSWIICTSSS